MFLKRNSEKAERLKEVPLFSGLNDRQLGRLAREVDEVEVPKGRVIARQGESGREFLLILQGSAVVERDGKKMAKLGPGDFFGEMSLLDGKPRSASVAAETDLVLLVMHSRSFAGVLAEIPALQKRLLVKLSERLRAADEMVAARN